MILKMLEAKMHDNLIVKCSSVIVALGVIPLHSSEFLTYY
jgi:hypothetical protein